MVFPPIILSWQARQGWLPAVLSGLKGGHRNTPDIAMLIYLLIINLISPHSLPIDNSSLIRIAYIRVEYMSDMNEIWLIL